jgi:aarF domain-containing kinase
MVGWWLRKFYSVLYKVSSKVGQIYSEMIFVQGYIHCDPHPGNILIRKNSRGVVDIVLLDHGLYHVSAVIQ